MRFQRQAVEFHLRNATAWANQATGTDLSIGVDVDLPGSTGVNVDVDNGLDVNGLVNLGAVHG